MLDDAFKNKLKSLGAVWFNLLLPETKAIPGVITPKEELLGLVYGRYAEERDNTVSRGVLIATSEHVILLNKKFMFKQTNEISYKMISGISYGRVLMMGTVSLHTRMGDIHVRTFNDRCAKQFVSAIEKMIFDRPDDTRP